MEYLASKGPPVYQPNGAQPINDNQGEDIHRVGDVVIEVRATGSVTSAFSLHVVYEDYYPRKPTDSSPSSSSQDDVDLFLVDHAANDMSLRTRYATHA